MNDPGFAGYLQGLGLGAAGTAGFLSIKPDAAMFVAGLGLVSVTASFVAEKHLGSNERGGETDG